MTNPVICTRWMSLLTLAAAAVLVGCDDGGSTGSPLEDTSTTETDGDGDVGDGDTHPPDSSSDDDTSESDGDDTSDDDAADTPTDTADATPRECESVDVTGTWVLDGSDSVSIRYSAGFEPVVEGSMSRLLMLFERYQPGPDVGTFPLGPSGDDANFGNCAHCLYVNTDTEARVFFADRGSIELRADPYSQVMDATVTDLRLIEVDVDPMTRASTPVPDGRCIEIAEVTVAGTFPTAGWTCQPERFNDDTTCDCECGAWDPDCGNISNCLPGDPSCDPAAEPNPVAGCEVGQFCAAEPVTFASECQWECTWADQAAACPAGTCVFDDAIEDRDRCIEDASRFVSVGIGEDCGAAPLQRYCAQENGFAMGYCGPNDICRAVCTEDSECVEPGHTCRKFLPPDGLGYCGPEPVDE